MKCPMTRLVKKPRLSLTTIGIFLICLDVVERVRDRLVVGLLAGDDLDQRHLVDRREEVDADEVLGTRDALGETGDRQRRRVGAEQRVRQLTTGSSSANTECLSSTDSKTASTTRSTALEVGVVGGRRDAGEELVASSPA